MKQPSYAWHAHDYREVLAMLEVTESGLSHEQYHKRVRKYGRNEFSETPPPSLASRVFGQIKSPLAFVLLVAFLITFVLAEYVDAAVILFALLIAVLVGVLQEGKASRAFKKLSESQERVATVWRDGAKHEIDAALLVPGDVVELLNGAQVPADVRLLKTKKLAINEAPLTGEWLAVNKQVNPVAIGTPFAEQKNMAWMGTYVAEGNGIGVVIATGDKTSVGELAQNLQNVVEETTPLQHEMQKVSMIMLYIISFLVLVIFALGLYQGQTLHDMLLMAIAISVASVPEGLPAAVTIILAVGMESLLKRGGLVRNLLAAETLGSTTYVLTDKTGTLTEARMAVTGLILNQATFLTPVAWASQTNTRALLEVALCAADAYKDQQGTEFVLRGDPVEKAILEAAEGMKISSVKDSLRANRIDYLPFTSENRYAAGLAPLQSGQFRLCINGAPEFLLERSDFLAVGDTVHEITEAEREALEAAISNQTREGKRLVAVAYKDVDFEDIPNDADEALLEGMAFAGIVVLNDPVREGVKDAIAGVKDAGAKILLITGDNPQTGLSIARKVGIAGPQEIALTGDDLAGMSDDEILAIIEDVHVFARVLPKQKMRIAEILQRSGEIVAMTGDGINDAPALRKANIGIAIGSGTEVAKEASDLVLVNDSFATIYAAIEEGRRIISNLRKIVGYLLSTSLSEVVLIGAAMMVGAPSPILPAQILWANVIEEGLMSVAFAFEKGEKGAMKRKPQDIHEEGILSGQMMWFLALVVTILSSLSVILYFYLRSLELPLEELRSAMFMAIAMDSLFISFAFRSLSTPLWRIPLFQNLFFVGSFILSAALFAGAISIPFMQNVLSYTPLPSDLIVLVVSFSAASLATIELAKFVFFEHKK